MLVEHVCGSKRGRTPRAAARDAVIPAALAVIVLLIAGCSSTEPPAMRTGSLPYPGPFTLYADADPDDLGTHRFRSGLLPPLFADEAHRGIVYTCRAGFLDLSHVRDSIDLTRYYYHAFADALMEGETEAEVYGFSPCRVHVSFDLPPQWADALAQAIEADGPLPEELDDALIELAVQTAWITTTWYEFLQWYGYRSSGLFSEKRSAFTYDDIIAHIIGAEIGRAALHRETCEETFNKAATEQLEHAMDELQAVAPEKLTEAVQLVQGKWWRGGQAIRRQLDLGLEDGTIRPWIVRDFEPCESESPRLFDAPPLTDALRPDGRALAAIEIEIRVFEYRAIRRAIPGRPERIVPHRDFPHLKADVHRDMAEQYGDDFDQPYPDDA